MKKLFDLMQPTDMLLKTFLKDIGFDGPEFKHLWSVDHDETVHIDVRYSYPMTMAEAVSTNTPVMKVFKGLQEKLANSEFVKREKQEVESKLAASEALVTDLKSQIAELEKFKTYYDLEKEMRKESKK